MRKHNFNPGPAVLPTEVLRQASEAVIDYAGMGLSILEISHREQAFMEVLERTQSMIKSLYRLDDEYEVLLMQGGASVQFVLVPMNFLGPEETAAYVDTGVWSAKAIQEARLFGRVLVAASSAKQQYTFIPKIYEVPAEVRYLHITSNNTVYGTQYHTYPSVEVPLVADMSSDIFSKNIDLQQFSLVYAGAQKNAGTAGVTLVIMRKEFLKRIKKNIPRIFDYRQWVDNRSLYNTPCVFAVYVCYLTLQWLQNQGGLIEVEQRNRRKAQLLYEAIDYSRLFHCPVSQEDRSMMNVVFRLDAQRYLNYKKGVRAWSAEEVTTTLHWLENQFLTMASARGIVGIRGHRVAGGFRASLYNALPMESVQVLADAIKDFEEEILLH